MPYFHEKLEVPSGFFEEIPVRIFYKISGEYIHIDPIFIFRIIREGTPGGFSEGVLEKIFESVVPRIFEGIYEWLFEKYPEMILQNKS